MYPINLNRIKNSSILFLLFISISSFSQTIFEITGPESTCAGSSFTLTAINCTGTIAWSTGETSVSITVSPTKTTTFYATCTVGGVKTNSSITPIVLPIAELTSSTENCLSIGQTTLSITNPSNLATYKWRKDGIEIAGITSSSYSPTTAGTYTVEQVHQGEWFTQHPVVGGTTLNDVDFINSNFGMAVGNGGTLLKTTNGGESWEIIELSTKATLNDIHFVNESIIWISGSSNTLLKSTNGGSTWSTVSTGGYYSNIEKIFFTDSQTGWLLSRNGISTILKTTNGGISWQSISTGSDYLTILYMIDNQNGWISGSNGLLKKTVDGGATWTTISVNGNTGSSSAIYFLNTQVGWVIFDNLLYKTLDGGTTWTSSNLNGYGITSIYFTDSSIGYYCNYNGVLRTTNGGSTWTLTTPSMNLKTLAQRNKFVAVGHSNKIDVSADGTTWQNKRGGEITSINAAKFVTNSIGWTIGANGNLYKTENGGKTWQNKSIDNFSYYVGIDFIDTQNGWITTQNSILKTTNGGSSWFTYSLPSSGNYPIVKFFNTTTGILTANYNDKILKTTDGGVSWTSLPLPVANFSKLSIIDENTIWIVSTNNEIYKTTNSGASWSGVYPGVPNYILFLQFKDASNGWIQARNPDYSVVYKKTNDGGTTWVPTNFPNSYNELTSMQFVNNLVGFCSTSNSYESLGNEYFTTNDGGNTWQSAYIPIYGSYSKVQLIDETNGWITIYPNVLMKYKKVTTSCPSNAISLQAPPSMPIISSSHTGILCGTSSVTLTVSGCTSGNTIRWSNGQTTTSIIVNPTKSSTYTVSCINSSGCLSTSIIEIPYIQAPNLIANSSEPYCSNKNIQLSSYNLSSDEINWKFNGSILNGTQSTNSLIVNNAGTYQVENKKIGTWTLQLPTPTNEPLFSISFPSENVGYMVGYNGTFLKTEDGGKIWYLQNSPNGMFKDVNFYDEQNGFITSSYGNTLYKTTNGGTTWQSIILPSYTTWHKIHFISSTAYLLVGSNAIYRSTDAGLNWTFVTTPVTSYTEWSDLSFVDSQNGWVSGSNGKIIKTTDGGISWTLQNSTITTSLNSITFKNLQVGYATINNYTNQLLHTTNGGETWEVLTSSALYNGNYKKVAFTVSKDFILSDDGYLYSSSDNGATWNSNKVAFSRTNWLTFENNLTGYIIGYDGLLLKTKDGGATWNTNSFRPKSSLTKIQAISDQVVFIGGSNGFIGKTTNGGKTWSKVSFPNTNYIESLHFYNGTTGWVADYSKIYKTTDGGTNWSTYNSNFPINQLQFINATNGWAVGYFGNLISTTDGGNTWQSYSTNSSESFNDLCFISTSTGWIAGTNGKILKTTDGGQSWQNVISPTTNSIYAIKFIDASNGWICGTNFLYKTTDGGSTWQLKNPAINFTFYSINILTINQLVVSGYSGSYFTTDAGETWEINNTINNGLYKISMNSPTIGWGISGSSIYKYHKATTNCSSPLISILASPSKPILTNTPNTILCEGETTTLAVSGCSDSFRWSTGSNVSSISISPVATTSYSAICTSSNGCTNELHIGVNVLKKPWIDTTLISVPCQRVNLIAENVFAETPINWYQNGSLVSTTPQSYLSTTTGNYTAQAVYDAILSPQSGSISNATFNRIFFVNPNLGFAIASNGTIVKTIDGGATWVVKPSKAAKNLSKIQFASTTVGWVLGNSVFLKSEDGGESWNKLHTPIEFIDFEFVDNLLGWAYNSNQIWKTTDGGVTWLKQVAQTNFYISSMDVISPLKVIFHGSNGKQLLSTNGGNTWQESTFANTFNYIIKTKFVTPTTGWIFGSGNLLLKTTDGGANWQQFPTGNLPQNQINTILPIDENNIWMRVASSYYRTLDGGTTWQLVGTPESMNGNTFDCFVLDANTAYAAGMHLTKTTNGGSTWVSNNNTNWNTYYGDLHFVNSSTGFVINNSSLLKTTDEGKSWTLKKTSNYTFNDVFFTNETTGWLVTNYNKEVFKSTDGGETWTAITTLPSQLPSYYSLKKIFFLNEQTGWIVGQNGTILKTTDAGASWSFQNSNTTNTLQSIHFIDTNNGIAVGDNSTALTTTNGGETWIIRSISSDIGQYLTSAQFTSPMIGWAVATNDSRLFKTTNGGVSWSSITIGNYPSSYTGLQFFDETNGILYGYSTISRTEDGGANWKTIENGTGAFYFHFLNKDKGWGAGLSLVQYKRLNNQNCPTTSSPYLFNRAVYTLLNPTHSITANPNINGTKIHANSTYGYINASNQILNNGTKVEYKAKSIDLKPGFKADAGTIFSAEVGGCN